MAPDPVAARGDSSGANGDGDADVEGNPAVRLHSHAFALNLPSHCRGADGVPHVTRYAEKKARDILKLVRSLVLTEEALLSDPSQAGEGAEAMDIEAAGDGGDRNTAKGPPSMMNITKMCSRLNSQLLGLENLKHSGLTQDELCEIFLRIMRMVSATVTYEDDGVHGGGSGRGGGAGSGSPGDDRTTKVKLRFDDVGSLLGAESSFMERIVGGAVASKSDDSDPAELERRLTDPFALPSPARETLLSVAIHLLSKKGPLMSVSNMVLVPATGDGAAPSGPDRILLINWKALLRMLLKTAPYLDERKNGFPPRDSSSRQSTVLRRTVELIRSCRRFFDQGLSPESNSINDSTARIVWDMVKNDVMYHSHSNSYFRAVILLYLFCPSRCSSEFYEEVLPIWMQCWTSVDRCPEVDYLWLVMFCRARKYVRNDGYNWAQLRRRLLTQCGYWLQLPMGGSSSDKSFPRAAPPRQRGLPARLKVFVGIGSSYQEGIDFVRKVSKLFLHCVGMEDTEVGTDANANGADDIEGNLTPGTDDLLRFLAFVTPYFHPSNNGPWTYPLGVLLHYLSYDFCRRISLTASMKTMHRDQPALAKELERTEPVTTRLEVSGREMAAMLNAFVPLCQQALYSKSVHVSSASESAMLYLIQIDPVRVCPPFLDLATRALDVSSVTMSHQAPAALSALNRLVQPSLRRKPSVLLRRLPEILSLSLAGIDSNDQNKTIRTLIFYRNLTSWLPIGNADFPVLTKGSGIRSKSDGTVRAGKDLLFSLRSICSSSDYKQALSKLPESSLLRPSFGEADLVEVDSKEEIEALLEETALVTSDWTLAFLDRIYLLLHAAGEQEKISKSGRGVASRHSSADVSQARNFSRVLKETLVQTFAAMDESTHVSAVQSVVRFLQEETLPFAAKDAAALCQSVSSVRRSATKSGTSLYHSPGLDALVPILTDELKRHSSKTIIYRLRCLAGAVKYSGAGVLKHKKLIVSAIEYALAHQDRHVLKTGCKLLRHTLASQCEAYPISSDTRARMHTIGKSAQLRGDPLEWHVPSGKQIDFAVDLLNRFTIKSIQDLAAVDGVSGAFVSIDTQGEEASTKNKFDPVPWRRCLRVLRYSLRGCSGILLDAEDYGSQLDNNDDVEAGPNEKAMRSLVLSSSKASQEAIMSLRRDLCLVIVSILSLIASETCDEEAFPKISNAVPSLSSDAKVCKEIIAVAVMLLTRRSALFRSSEMSAICTAQKELITDFAVADEAEFLVSALHRASLLGADGTVSYKDGEDGGKTVPRRLLAARVNIFQTSIQRDASYAVPRRLRKIRDITGSSSQILFSHEIKLDDVIGRMKILGKNSVPSVGPSSLDAYEGIIDGLFAASCLSNAIVRSAALSSIDYALTRFGWVARLRIPRLLSAVSLQDGVESGKCGLPSCAHLSTQTDSNGKRKRFAEVFKGVCSIISLSRIMKEMLATEGNRLALAKSLCATQNIISLLPAEEMQKIGAYFQNIFSAFRSRFFLLPRINAKDRGLHESLLSFLLGVLAENLESSSETASTEGRADETSKSSINWRNRLTTGWVLTSSIDERDLLDDDPTISERLWTTSFHLIATELGQPLQRVALGLLGRLVTLALIEMNLLKSDEGLKVGEAPQQIYLDSLRQHLTKAEFCASLGTALVYDHKADTTVGGGHDAQWSAGVDEIIRDASANVAPKILFPFQRTSRSSATFKVSHAQLVCGALTLIGRENALVSCGHLLKLATEMASALPSEDQKNQVCTSAEIFSGVIRGLLQSCTASEEVSDCWQSILLPFLVEVVPKIPISCSGAFYDSIRYGIHLFPPTIFYDLTEWIITRIEATLWQSSDEISMETTENGTSEGFAMQSKWLYLLTAVLVELDNEADFGASNQLPWYSSTLLNESVTIDKVSSSSQQSIENLRTSWKAVCERVLPRLLSAIGHPYEKCRDHISSCLFRICYCDRKFESQMKANDVASAGATENPMVTNPGKIIVEKLVSIDSSEDFISFKVQRHAMITARKFMVYCIHMGDCKDEFPKFVIPLIPLAFEGLKVTLADDNGEVDPSDRMLEAEVVKGFRYQLAEVSNCCQLTYGNEVDISRVIDVIDAVSNSDMWQVRQAAANVIRCFQGGHRYLFSEAQSKGTMKIVTRLLGDERREVSAAAMAALTGILASMPLNSVASLVTKQIRFANKSIMKKKRKKAPTEAPKGTEQKTEEKSAGEKENNRARRQQTSVNFLSASILARPYDTPPYVPEALAAISRHSFDRTAPLTVRDTVKMCCAEFKKTHMSDNWVEHKKQFTQEQLEALDDVVSTPHYYA